MTALHSSHLQLGDGVNGISRIFVLIFFSAFLSGLVSSVAQAEKRNQLEELFIWKMSEELKLTAIEEKRFAEIVKNINSEKSTLNKTLQESVGQMAKVSGEKAQGEALKKYRKDLARYNRLSEDEIERMQGLLGVGRTIQYLQIKQDLTNKVKSLLISPEAKGKTEDKPQATMPTPKIIEEK